MFLKLCYNISQTLVWEVTQVNQPWQRIISLSVQGGFLDGQQLTFSPRLNCLVGGRGAGKTTVVELLRYGLDCPPIDPQLARQHQQHVQGVLNGGRVTVTVQAADGGCYQIRRRYGERPEVYSATGQPLPMLHQTLPVRLIGFGQSELEQVAESAATRLAILDSMIPELQRYTEEMERLLERLAALRSPIADLEREIKQLQQKTQLIPELEQRLAELDRFDLEGLMAQRQRREQEQFCLATLYREAQRRERQFSQRIAEPLGEMYTAGPNEDIMESALQCFTETVRQEQAQCSRLAQAWADTAERLGRWQNSLFQRHRAEEEQQRPLLERLHQHNLQRALEERSQYTKLLLELQQLAGQLKQRQQQWQKLHRRRQQLQAEREELAQKLFQCRHNAARQATARMGDKLRVTVSQQAHYQRYQDFLTAHLQNTGLHYRRWVEAICAHIPPAMLAQIIRNDEKHLLVTVAGISPQRVDKVFDWLKSRFTFELLLELEEMILPDWVEVEMLDGERWKTSDQLSKGQRCTAVLPLLLLESSQPLVIDQPEDHLDNAYIYSTVVPALRQVKAGRQVILATHNANIPVLGEAENNIVLDSNGHRGWVACQGGLDNGQVVTLLELLLEGGPSALQKRLQVYRDKTGK